MAPAEPSVAREQRIFVDRHGEGAFSASASTSPDRDEALGRAERMGVRVGYRFDLLDLFPQWHGRFATALESQLERVHGVSFNFCQIEERAEQPSA
jgi:hypothetical protein